MPKQMKVHIEDPNEPKKTLCGKVEKYLDKRKLEGSLPRHPLDDVTCKFCRNLALYGTNRGDLHA